MRPRIAEAAEFEALEAEIDSELLQGSAVPLCNQPLHANAAVCAKPADVSRGAGYAAANERACAAASNGLGCELVKEKGLYFPKCAAGFHVVAATPSLCSLNCPMGWADEPAQCIKTAAADQQRYDPSNVQNDAEGGQSKYG